MNPIKVKLSDLIADPKNTRVHNKKNIEVVKSSLQKFGQYRPFVVQKEGMIVRVGNGMLVAMKELGWEEGFAEIKELTDDEATSLSILDNKSAELATWDEKLLAESFKDLDEEMKKITGFDNREIMKLLKDNGMIDEDKRESEVDVDEADELQKKWKTSSGQLWSLGKHRLICGDSTDSIVVERLMNGEKACLFATDPPYGVAYNDETGSGKKDTIANDESDGNKLELFLESCFRCWKPFLNDTAAWYLWHALVTQYRFESAAIKACDILISRQIIWVKPSLILGHGDYHWKHESCLYGWQRGFRPPFYGERNQTTVWECDRDKKTLHPTQKPYVLWEAPMNNHTQINELCAEPFSGSGSQIIAGEKYGRRVYASELEPKWIAVALERWSQMTGIQPEIIK